VKIADPDELSVLRIAVGAVGSSAGGVAVANFAPPGDTGRWWGLSAGSTVSGGAWRTVEAGSLDLTWTHYNAEGVLDGGPTTAKIPAFASEQGAETMRVGFAFGCGGSDFWLDKLQVKTSGKMHTWDFEEFQTVAGLAVGSRARATVVRPSAKVRLTADLRTAVGKDPVAGEILLERRSGSKGPFRLFKRGELKASGTVTFASKVRRPSSFRVRYAGSTDFGSDRSATVLVKVRPKVTAQLGSRVVRRGSAFVVHGRVRPGHAAGIRLQRQVGKSWSTVKRMTAKKDGMFRLVAVSNSLGKSRWRVIAPAGRGYASATSAIMVLTTKPKPKSGGGSPTPTPTPTPIPTPIPTPTPPDGPR